MSLRSVCIAIAAALGSLLVALPGTSHAQVAAQVAHGAAASPDRLMVRSDQAMGTRITLTLWAEDEVAAAQAAAAVFEEFRRIDRLMTTWLPDSDVSRINAAAGVKAVRVDPEVITVILKAQEVARLTDGAFDITVGILFHDLWKFDHDKDDTIPDPAAVRARLPLINYRDVLVDARQKTVKLRRKGMRITLGGIAKGYAVDRGIHILRERGFVDFILQAGGDLYVSGRRDNRRWRVGIRDPRSARAATFAVAEIENRTFSTSGDYERSVIKDGVRYHHILDPATGNPATRSRSVTVMAEDALTADAWSTALFVMGVEKGMPLVEKLPELDAVFVDASNQVHMSSGLTNTLWVYKQPTPGI